MTDWAWIGVGIGVSVLLILGAWALFNRFIGPVFGPIFWYDAVRMARRGQQPRLRALLVGLLLIGLLIAYLRQFRDRDIGALLVGGTSMPLNESAQFAETFLITFLTAQLLAVLLITPAIAASAITEEKERGTIDFLRSSLLSNRELVLGKFAARIAYVYGIVLAGLPVLALTSLFGGIDLGILFGGYVITGMSVVSLAGFSLFLAVRRDTLRDVLVWVYGVVGGLTVLGLCCGCIPGVSAVSPIAALTYLFVSSYSNPSEPIFWINVGAFAFIHGLAGSIFTLFAITGIRAAGPGYRRTPKRKRDRSPKREARVPGPLPIARRSRETDPEAVFDRQEEEERAAPRRQRRRTFEVPRMKTTDPFFWKERYFSGRLSWMEAGMASGCGIAVGTMILFIFGVVLFVWAAIELDRGRWIGEPVNGVVKVLTSGAAALSALALGTRAAGLVALERQKQTLDALLTVPVERRTVLWAKWFASVHWLRYFLIGLAAIWIVALLVGGIFPPGFFAAAFQTIGWLIFANTLGLWLSVRCKTVTRSTVWLIVILGANCFLPIVLTPVAGLFGNFEESRQLSEFMLDLCPPIGIASAQEAWEPFSKLIPLRDWMPSFIAGCTSGLAYLLVSGLLWLDSIRVFDKEGK